MKQTPAYRNGPNSGLTRYGSAPGSLLTSIAESVISEGGAGGFGSVIVSGPGSDAVPMTRFFSSGGGDHSPSSLTSESSCLQRPSYNGDRRSGGGGGLLRQSSSPAGFFSHFTVDEGFSVNRGMRHYPQQSTRLKSQLSFSRQEPLSQISEITIPDLGDSVGNSSEEGSGFFGQSYISNNYSIGSLDETNSIAFSAPSSKRTKESSEDLLASLSHIDSQFSLPTSLEMADVEKLLHSQQQQNSVAFKVRAKRGCATHPRSIAERERRTRISKKLKKLEELVPNMDKQTSTSDMLDFAVQHIKGLQKQVQNLNEERANCKCACEEEIP